MNATSTHQALLDAVAERARQSELFESVEVAAGLVRGHAKVVESDCWYQVGPLETVDNTSRFWVGIHTPDRWLSGSIEADLLNLGDKYEDLLEEELVEQGWSGNARLPVEHFRDDDKVFVFRSPVEIDADQALDDPALAERLAQAMFAYESAFRELGDMVPEED